MLEGMNSGWTGTWDEEVIYHDLPEGEYIFKVVAVNRDLKASGSPAELRIDVAADPREKRIRELTAAVQEHTRKLREAETTIKELHGLLPICAMCKKIRDDQGSWHRLKKYITEHSEAEFTHGYCPDCAAKVMKEAQKDGEST
jgi:hypothetical protein